MRKDFLTVLLMGFVFISFLTPPVAFGQERGPIKIGFLAPLTGPFAQIGKDMLDGANLYLEEIGHKMAGRKVELIVEDDEANPAGTLNKARKLVEMNKVDMLSGILLAASCYALQPYVDGKGVPTVISSGGGDDITQRKRARWMIRLNTSGSQPGHPMGDYAYSVLGYRKIVTLGMDYAYPWEWIGGFQKVFEESGGKIIQKIWVPLNAQDFAPYLPHIRKDADAVSVVLMGKLAMVFFQQYQAFGMKDKIPVIGAGTTTGEAILPAMGDEALGAITSLWYSAAIDTPINKAFVKKYREKFGKIPSEHSTSNYTALQWINQAVISLEGEISNRQKLMKALKSVVLKETHRGPVKLDAYGNVDENVYMRKVERVNGELQNTIIYTYPDVSQFWKYKPEEFLKQPVYSRDYPPLKP